MKFILMVVVLLPLGLMAGCADDGGATATAGAAINAICPMMGGKIDGTTSTEWNGQTIGFCCPPCIDAWNELSDEEKKEALAEAAEGHADHEHGDHSDHDEHADHDEHDHGDDTEDVKSESTPATEESAK